MAAIVATDIGLHGFQSYQFRQINPDVFRSLVSGTLLLRFQSYQFRQINPDPEKCTDDGDPKTRFNRINSDRSIPTKLNSVVDWLSFAAFQSYQFRQINPDQVKFRSGLAVIRSVSIVSIQTDQSRPS